MRILSIVLALAMLLSLPVLAEETQPSMPQTEPVPTEAAPTEESIPIESEPPTVPATQPTTLPATEPTAPVSLEIDTVHLYKGMEKPYESGYRPLLADGMAQIVLPVKAVGGLRDNRLKASLDLGMGQELPFVAASYEKEFRLASVLPENSTEAQKIYLISFEVALAKDRINGTYPVTVRISAYDEANQPVSLEHTVFVTVTDGRSGEPEIPTMPEPEKPTADPMIYISGAKLEPEIAMAGEPFALTLTLQSSLPDRSVEHLLLTVEPENLQINLLEDSPVIPLGRLGAGETKTVTLHFDTDPSISAEKHRIFFKFQYDSRQTLGLRSEGSYILDVRQSARLDFDGAFLPVKVFQQDTVQLSVDLMNTGKSTLYNCRIDYEIEGLASGGTTFLGELQAGSNKVGTGNLRVGSDRLGEVSGIVRITYEDAFGQVYTKEAEVATTIEEKPAPEPVEMQEEPTQNRHWWAFVLLGVALGGGLGFGIPWLIRDRRQRQEDDLRL